MSDILREVHTTVCCAHPYYGFVCTPNAIIDFSDRVPPSFGHAAIAEIDQHGFRNTNLPGAKSDDEFWIGVFGGSVAFGVPVSSNANTIGAHLERRLNTPRRDGKRVRVVNFAIPGGQQPQQLMVLLLNRHLLDGVITFDGVNEVVVPSCYNKGYTPPQFPYRPYYEILYGQAMSAEQICDSVLAERRTAAFRRRPAWLRGLLAPFYKRDMARRRSRLRAVGATPAEFRSIFGDSRDVSAVALATSGARSWAEYTALMYSVCRAQRIEALFVVQPIPDRAKPLTDFEQMQLKVYPDIVAIRAAGYERVLAHAADLRAKGCPIVDFDDVFSTCPQTIYTDMIHFEDVGSRIVAERLSDWIVRHWAGFAA